MCSGDWSSAVCSPDLVFAVILYDAALPDADLSGARLIGPMNNAKAQRAKFIKANLGVDPGNQGMGIMRVDASSVNFSGADLTGANLRKVPIPWFPGSTPRFEIGRAHV